MANTEEPDLFQPDQVVADKYRVVRLLGMGGVGAVYEVEHIELHRHMALKVLRHEFFANQKVHARFLQEARSAASIRHPGIVTVHDLGTANDITFIAMELMEGEELIAKVQREHPLPIPFVVEVGCDLVDAVAAAHDHGIIHRDLKPQNVFLAREGRRRNVVKVLDFGLAKNMKDYVGVALTRTGDVFGSPLYMSPEQLRNAKDVDGRSDVYAIGVILFECLAGSPPFTGSFHDVVIKIFREPPPLVTEVRPDAPKALADIIDRCVAKKRGDRFSTLHELLASLERVSESLG